MVFGLLTSWSSAGGQAKQAGVSDQIVVANTKTDQGQTIVGKMLVSKVLQSLRVQVVGVESRSIERIGQSILVRGLVNQFDDF